MAWLEIVKAVIVLSVLLLVVQLPSVFLSEYLKAKSRQQGLQAFTVVGKNNKRLAVRLNAIKAIGVDERGIKFVLGNSDTVWFELGTEEDAGEVFDTLVKLANAEAKR